MNNPNAPLEILLGIIGSFLTGAAAMWGAYNNWRKNIVERISRDEASKAVERSQMMNEAMDLFKNLRTDYDRLQAENRELHQYQAQLEGRIQQLSHEVETVRKDTWQQVEVLRARIKESETENTRLKERVREAEAESVLLKDRVKELETENVAQKEKIEALTAIQKQTT